jgi:endonuclease YncB( thermonuclease family)
MKKILLILGLFFLASPLYYTNAEETQVVNAKAIDGDTIYVRGIGKVRIIGIDTPEKGEPSFESAKSYLQSLLNSGNVKIKTVGKDKYGRTLARVYVNNKDVAISLKEAGFDKKKSQFNVSTPKSKHKSSYSLPATNKPVKVKGYYKKDGTYIKPHYRSAPKRR